MSRFRFSLPDFFVIFSILAFILIKLPTLSVRFGDGNVYIYAAHLILTGLLPYRDFFVVVPPFLLYFLTPFSLIFQQNLWLYSLIPIICEIFSSIFIYLILRKLKHPAAFVAPFIYLFSFTILSTTDYLTGVCVVNLLVTLALLLFAHQKFVPSGVVFGFAIMTKFYALPIVAGVGLFLLLRRKYANLTSFLTGATLALIVILLPYLIFSPHQIGQDLIAHPLNRPPGIPKFEIFSFFFGHELILIFLSLSALFIARLRSPRSRQVGTGQLVIILPLLLLSLFFLFFSDVYYLYLASLLPFLTLLAVSSLEWLWESHRHFHQTMVIFVILVLFFIAYQASDYLTNTSVLGKFDNSPEISSYVSTLPPQPLIGSHDVTPAIALLSSYPVFQNIIDTNPQTFRSGANNLFFVSQAASTTGVYLIARTINHPELQTDQIGFEDYFDKAVFDKACTKLRDFPSLEIEIYNQITIYNCKSAQ